MANFYSTLRGIPIDYLVATPLLAAARANLALAQNLEEFIKQVAYKDGKEGGDLNMLSFKLERPYAEPDTGKYTTENINVNVPLLAVVPIPALLVDSVTVNFTTTVNTSTTTTTNVNVCVGANYGFAGFHVSGQVTTDVGHMRSSNQTATYSFVVQADQQQPTEGMSKLVDVFSSVITPMPPPSSGGGGGGGGGD